MRDLHLTSPLTRGLDVQHFQQALNQRLQARGESRVAADGQYGPATAHAAAIVTYDLGLNPLTGTTVPSVVSRVIEHPMLRTPAQLIRAKQRAKQRHDHPAGLANIPVIAARYIGVHEVPAGSNTGHPEPSGWQKEIIGSDGSPWCGCFSGGMIILAGGHVTSRIAYCPFVPDDARAGVNGFDRWTTDWRQAGPGWVVIYQFPGFSVPDHQGVVESLHPDHLVAIEGNTSGADPQDGGSVARTQRTYNSVVGFARPRF